MARAAQEVHPAHRSLVFQQAAQEAQAAEVALEVQAHLVYWEAAVQAVQPKMWCLVDQAEVAAEARWVHYSQV